jgi:hypothetical protein
MEQHETRPVALGGRLFMQVLPSFPSDKTPSYDARSRHTPLSGAGKDQWLLVSTNDDMHWLGEHRAMNVTGMWILVMGILALPGAALITRWMSPIGAKTWGMIAGLCGGIAGILLLEVLAGGLYGITSPIAGEDAVSVALISFLGVSAASAAVGLLVNWLINVWQTRSKDQEALEE